MRMLINDEQGRKEFISRIEKIELKARTFIADFKVFRKQRSLKQNKLYWMWLNCIHDDTGNDVDSLHEYFAGRYLPWNSKKVFDEEIKKRVSTKQLSSGEFTEYLEHIKMEMVAEGISLPEPRDYGWDEFYVRYGIEK